MKKIFQSVSVEQKLNANIMQFYLNYPHQPISRKWTFLCFCSFIHKNVVAEKKKIYNTSKLKAYHYILTSKYYCQPKIGSALLIIIWSSLDKLRLFLCD